VQFLAGQKRPFAQLLSDMVPSVRGEVASSRRSVPALPVR